MYDKELINKVCKLTFSKEELYGNQTTINYDIEYPFKKYYDINIIIGAINKYLTKEWDDRTLAHWCCTYNWILCGGFHDDLKEDLNPLEEFLKEVISWNLDGLSFFDEDNYLEEDDDMSKLIEYYRNFDYVWQTRNEWSGVYSPIGTYDKINGDQYVLLINEKRKEYIIIFSSHLSNNYKNQNEYLKYTSKNKFIKLIEKTKKEDYSILSWSEEFYYSELNEN